ncbi:glucokinase [Magnetospira sp. QH-2]|uniref:glucokinase n=1 Tax=Magnetospira sp. (strain QH-2) TaxID=1288970 RepID=UPI0003E81136|nr:glucokinase [Magnetospira sp. QH-2]CCQ75583.1 Glucokinase [Magnetospira sp. QH-2]
MTASPGASPGLGLIADIGGTNARFALCDETGKIFHQRTLQCADYPGLLAAAQAYLADAAPSEPPCLGAFDVAGPVDGDRIEITNNPWAFSIEETRQALSFDRLEVVNDFAANALAAPHIVENDRVPVGGGTPTPGRPMAVIGPGTGLGTALVVPHDGGYIPVPGEGGHATLPAADDEEAAVIHHLRHRHGPVFAEQLISGSGLVNLHCTLSLLRGVPVEPMTPAQVGAGTDAQCRDALDMMFALLGTVAGDLALYGGARGGVFVMGGIVPRYLERFQQSKFRQRFVAKGGFEDYMEAIPTWVVTHPLPAFVGLVSLITEQERTTP